jgi:hypothetical protein
LLTESIPLTNFIQKYHIEVLQHPGPLSDSPKQRSLLPEFLSVRTPARKSSRRTLCWP